MSSPNPKGGRKNIPWDQAPLGKMTDKMVAAIYNCSHQSVGAARKRRGIPAFVPNNGKGTGVTDEYKDLLGKLPDGQIAEILGLSRSAVNQARRKFGIPRYQSTWAIHTRRPAGICAHIDWDNQPLGKVNDAELAKKLGVHISSVLSARVTRSIPVYGKGEYIWGWDKVPRSSWGPEGHVSRKGQKVYLLAVCRNTVLVEFEDGLKVVSGKGGLKKRLRGKRNEKKNR